MSVGILILGMFLGVMLGAVIFRIRGSRYYKETMLIAFGICFLIVVLMVIINTAFGLGMLKYSKL